MWLAVIVRGAVVRGKGASIARFRGVLTVLVADGERARCLFSGGDSRVGL